MTKNSISKKNAAIMADKKDHLTKGFIKWQYEAIIREEGVEPGSFFNMRWDIDAKNRKSAKKVKDILEVLGSINGDNEYSVALSRNELNGGYNVYLHISDCQFILKKILTISEKVKQAAEKAGARFDWWHTEIPRDYYPGDEGDYIIELY